eukprot:GHRR01028008.1.p1 GENE.GHRR01028008.1~~GHRR01028008.1.p1  ORF type:complete len:176 (+),score=20.16 GHRR01028008.1:1959-2486(+)
MARRPVVSTMASAYSSCLGAYGTYQSRNLWPALLLFTPRFPDGESGSDVYNRISIFEDHLIRDMKSGRFTSNTSLCMVTHGLTMRVFLMRWFNWTVENFLQVYNPANATPIVIEKISEQEFIKRNNCLRERRQTLQVKNAYRLRPESMTLLGVSARALLVCCWCVLTVLAADKAK